MSWRHQNRGEPELFICTRNENDIVLELDWIEENETKNCPHCWRSCSFEKTGDRVRHYFNLEKAYEGDDK